MNVIEVGKSLHNQDVILTLPRLMRIYGNPPLFAQTMARNLLQPQG